jgi:hypothetical protein
MPNADDKMPRWTVESLEVLDSPDSLGKIFKLSNATVITNKNFETIHIPGKTYIGEAQLYLWHFIYDDLAQYSYLKKHIPDLNLFLFAAKELKCSTKEEFLNEIQHFSFHQRHEEKLDNYPHRYFEDLVPLFLKQDHLPNLWNGNYSFEEIYFVHDTKYYFKNLIELIQSGNHWFGLRYAFWLPFGQWENRADRHRTIFPDSWWRDIGMLELRKVFLDQIKDYPKDTPKKIFVSRQDAQKRHRLVNDPGVVNQRIIEDDLLEAVEDSFESNGYEMVHLEGMGYFDQLNLFKNATHVAGFAGTGLGQTLVCNPRIVLTQLFATPLYQFSYKFISKVIKFRLQNIDFRHVSERDKIKEVIDKHCGYADSFIDSQSKSYEY